MSHRSARRRAVTLPAAALLLVALTGLLASCGSSSGSGSSAAASSTDSGAAGGSAPLVTTKADAKLGTILADQEGRTLYTLTNGGRPVECGADCQAVWPPLVLPAGVRAPTGASGVGDLGVVQGSGGQQLVAVHGLPLYTFVKDQSRADANGEGIASFGGVWHVVRVPSASSDSGSTVPTSTGSGSTGY